MKGKRWFVNASDNWAAFYATRAERDKSRTDQWPNEQPHPVYEACTKMVLKTTGVRITHKTDSVVFTGQAFPTRAKRVKKTPARLRGLSRKRSAR